MTFQYPSPPIPQRKSLPSRILSFLRSHPILFLILLTPGIPEYLSASSSLSMLAFNPILFFLLLGANIGLYGTGVILIREAMIRWKKGWVSVFLLGAAYGIVEEGLALRTLFNPASPVVGTLGVYGHWLGVNWVWTIGLLIFHSVYSIGIPIFLFGLVFPNLNKKSLVSRKGLGFSILALTIDSILLSAIVNYDPGAGLILFSALIITILVIVAKKLPTNFVKTKLAQPKWSPLAFGALGSLLFPATLFTGALSAGSNAPPIVPFLLDIFFTILIFTRALHAIGNGNNQEHKVAFATGLLIPIALFGIIASIAIFNPLIILADISFILFSRRLWTKWHHWTLLQRSRIQTILPGFTSSPNSTFPS